MWLASGGREAPVRYVKEPVSARRRALREKTVITLSTEAKLPKLGDKGPIGR
jgi:hypothetical protein